MVTKYKPTLLLLDNSQWHLCLFGGVIIVPTRYRLQTETLMQVHLCTFHEVCEERVWRMVKEPSWKIRIITRHPIHSETVGVRYTHTGVQPLNTHVYGRGFLAFCCGWPFSSPWTFWTLRFSHFKLEFRCWRSAFSVKLKHRSTIFIKISVPCKPCWNQAPLKSRSA
jgi:hypothetical protein